MNRGRVQAVVGWGVAALLGVVAVTLPRLLDLNGRLGRTGFFTPEAYGTAVALLVTGMIVASVSERDAMRRAAVVGLGPMFVTFWRSALEGPGNLWPIALLFDLILGLPPALLGAWIARAFRRFRT